MKFDTYVFASIIKQQILCQYNSKLIIIQNLCTTLLFILQFNKVMFGSWKIWGKIQRKWKRDEKSKEIKKMKENKK